MKSRRRWSNACLGRLGRIAYRFTLFDFRAAARFLISGLTVRGISSPLTTTCETGQRTRGREHGAENTGQLELRLSWFETDTHDWLPISILHLGGEDLGECVSSAASRAEQQGGSPKEVESFRQPLAGLVLTILLYLADEPDVVRIVHPGEKPVKDSVRKRDLERFRDLDVPKVHRVGSHSAARSSAGKSSMSATPKFRMAVLPALICDALTHIFFGQDLVGNNRA